MEPVTIAYIIFGALWVAGAITYLQIMATEAEIKAQCMDGRVKIQYEDEEIEHMVDLSQLKYEWL